VLLSANTKIYYDRLNLADGMQNRAIRLN